MIQLTFPDKCVTYSQNQAFKMFGQGNIRRWRQKGLVEPVSKRPGKIEYRISDLRLLQQRKQDYF